MNSIVVVCGPTGVGKSAFAVRLACERGGEIVNADSQQVYRRCDIGTGKLPCAERQGIPHHCLDLAPPDQLFNVAQYCAAADVAIADIIARGRVPIVAGGTGLYLQALVYGLCEAPPADHTLRRELEAVSEHGALHRRLAAVDPAAAERIHPRHRSRIIRALEVIQSTGRSIIDAQAAHQFASPRYHAEWIGLDLPRPELYARIDERVAAMLAAGWLTEVRMLLETYGPDIAPLRAIGYRELVQQLVGTIDASTATALIQQNTRRFAKRQLTWFRRVPDIRWQKNS